MTKKQALKWTKALRSGKYKQGKNKLHDAQGNYCCLGVACEIFTFKNVTVLREEDGTISGLHLESQPDILRLLNIKNEGFLGTYLGEEIPGYCAPPKEYCSPKVATLAFLNDRNFTFDEIADIIELKWVHGAF